MRAPLLVLVALLPALAALAAPAAAQVPVVASQLSVSIQDPGGTGLTPGTETGVTVTFSYRPDLGGQPAYDPLTGNPVPTKVRFEVVRMPSWVNASRFEPLEANVTPPASGSASGNVTLVLTIAADAPARVREEVVVRALAAPNGNIRESAGESPPVTLRARVVTSVNVTAAAESPVFIAGGRWTTVPFVVRNDGNDEVKVDLNVTTRPEDSQIDLPEKRLVLPKGASATVEVGLRMPWTAGSLGTLELEALPLSDDEEVAPVKAAVDVSARSATPGAPLPLLALACVAAALLARRFRTP